MTVWRKVPVSVRLSNLDLKVEDSIDGDLRIKVSAGGVETEIVFDEDLDVRNIKDKRHRNTLFGNPPTDRTTLQDVVTELEAKMPPGWSIMALVTPGMRSSDGVKYSAKSPNGLEPRVTIVGKDPKKLALAMKKIAHTLPKAA